MPEAAAPGSMRAWRVTRLGEPADVLSLDEVAVPTPGPGEVLLRVAAVAANFPDVLLARGKYQVKPDLPFILGIECSGMVAALGSGVTGLAIGDRVVGAKIGVLAEYAVVPATAVQRIPDALSDEAAAGLTIAHQTAWFAPHTHAAYTAVGITTVGQGEQAYTGTVYAVADGEVSTIEASSVFPQSSGWGIRSSPTCNSRGHQHHRSDC